jgi:predicted DNA-binding protein YlxM (UPF0122 family)
MSDMFSALPQTVQYKNLLFDFYGGLLTEKQRTFFTMHYMDDLSLTEIGEHNGVTPQAVADLLKRANRLLDGYEAKMGLVGKLKAQREALGKLETLTYEAEQGADVSFNDIRRLASEMLL